MQATHYIHSLTPLRGIAALWVVLFHIDVSLFYRDLGALVSRDASGIFSRGYLWVDFFFLLSGFIIAHVYSSSLSTAPRWPAIKNYLWARFARIYPLHLFTLLLLVLLAPLCGYWFPSIIDGSWKTYFSWSALDDNLLFLNAMNQHEYLSWNMVSWSIGAEWWTYVAALGVIIGLWQQPLPRVLAAMLVAFGSLALLVYWLPEKKLDITFNYGFLRCLFEFVIGLGVYQFFRRSFGHRWLQMDLTFWLLMLLVVIIFHFRLPDLWVIPVFGLLILATAHNRTGVFTFLNWQLLQYLGKISYSIYLIHGVWFLIFWFALPAFKVALGVAQLPLLFKLAYAVTFLALTLVAAHFSYRYIEMPGRRWFKPRPVQTLLPAVANINSTPSS